MGVWVCSTIQNGSISLLYHFLKAYLPVEQFQSRSFLKFEFALPYNDDSQKGSLFLLYHIGESLFLNICGLPLLLFFGWNGQDTLQWQAWIFILSYLIGQCKLSWKTDCIVTCLVCKSPGTQFFNSIYTVLWDRRVWRFRPATARYPAHFSQKTITMAKHRCLKKDSPHCALP